MENWGLPLLSFFLSWIFVSPPQSHAGCSWRPNALKQMGDESKTDKEITELVCLALVTACSCAPAAPLPSLPYYCPSHLWHWQWQNTLAATGVLRVPLRLQIQIYCSLDVIFQGSALAFHSLHENHHCFAGCCRWALWIIFLHELHNAAKTLASNFPVKQGEKLP